jgi:hypothetical protein
MNDSDSGRVKNFQALKARPPVCGYKFYPVIIFPLVIFAPLSGTSTVTREEATSRLICEEKNRLVMEYAAASRSVARAARKLNGLRAEEFKNALAQSKAARAACSKARLALRRHQKEHGC